MKKSWKKLSSKIVHKNPWYYIRQDKVIRPNGEKGEYYVVVKSAAVFIIAMNDKNEVYLVELYRYANSVYSIEIPGGGSENQKPLVAAKRELLEETGIKAKKWKLLGRFQTANGFLDQYSYVFLAQGLKETANNKEKEEGIQKVIKVPIKKVWNMIKDGKITDGQTIAAFALASNELGKKF
jgi:8-oxo-dGTP pyrophosphatase MutT (NUDIX family)